MWSPVRLVVAVEGAPTNAVLACLISSLFLIPPINPQHTPTHPISLTFTAFTTHSLFFHVLSLSAALSTSERTQHGVRAGQRAFCPHGQHAQRTTSAKHVSNFQHRF